MNGEPLLDTAALQSKLDDPRLRVFDATLHFASDGKTRSGLSDWEAGHIPGFRSAGRIAGSQNAPFTDVLDPETGTLLGEDALREFFEVGDTATSDRVITYCGGGIAATMTGFALRRICHSNVADYDGSLNEWWRDPNLPMEVGEEQA